MANLDLLNEFWKRTEQEEKWRGYAKEVRRARPFALDDELADIVGRLMRSRPRDLYRYLISARLPYPTMWLEADYEAAFGYIDRVVGTDGNPYWMTKAAPLRIGWLLTETPAGGVAVLRVARVEDPISGEMGGAMIYPTTYLFSSEKRMHVDGSTFRNLEGVVDPEILRALRTWNMTPLASAAPWGWDGKVVAGSRPIDELDQITAGIRASGLFETCASLLEPQTVQRLMQPRVDEPEPLYDRTMSILMASANDQYGDIAYIVAALALINEVPVKYVPYRPSGSMRAGGTLRPYMQSSVVTIEVPASRRRLKDIRDDLKHKGEQAIRARHEVRGHWRHVQKLPLVAADNHRWERWTDRDGRPCWRTWIEHHERGSGQIGFVRQTYEVARGRGSIPGVDEGRVHVGV